MKPENLTIVRGIRKEPEQHGGARFMAAGKKRKRVRKDRSGRG